VTTVRRPDRTSPAAPAAPSEPGTRLGRILAGGAPDELRPYEVRGLGRVVLRLLRRREEEEVDLAVARWLADRAREIGGADVVSAVGMPVTKRTCHETLCRAVRDPDDPTVAFGSFEDWGEIDDEILGVLWVHYTDLRAELDPVAAEVTEAEAAAILDALAKKNWSLVSSFGSVKLTAWLRTTDARPAT
jgi:hypothetical protein